VKGDVLADRQWRPAQPADRFFPVLGKLDKPIVVAMDQKAVGVTVAPALEANYGTRLGLTLPRFSIHAAILIERFGYDISPIVIAIRIAWGASEPEDDLRKRHRHLHSRGDAARTDA
jgi:hypothetical protein